MIEVTAVTKHSHLLSKDAIAFLERLCAMFAPIRDECLATRVELAEHRKATGTLLDFPFNTAGIRTGDWQGPIIPEDLIDRRVEITGPTDRKMVINALNSGAKVFMADFEDSLSPTWNNIMDGQVNLYDAVRRDITYHHPTKGTYRLNDSPAVLMVRPRGLHLDEIHVRVGDIPVPASLVDFGLYFFHNAQELIDRGSGPYFYLPKLESFIEARWWNAVFEYAQDYLGITRGTIRATVLIETLPAAYQMEEILYELRDHSAGLNCGRWDYIFSYIKTVGRQERFLLPDRSQITMHSPFMDAYVRKLIDTCHRRGVHAMGGMAAQIPIKNDPDANRLALDAVCDDKLREVTMGHDGTWVAHPALVPIAMKIFDTGMPAPNQIDGELTIDTNVTASDLMVPPSGTRTYEGLIKNIDIALRYIDAWLRGSGCVPLYNLMEDAATAEISRAQIWQWVYHGATMDNGETITMRLVDDCIAESAAIIRDEQGTLVNSRIEDAVTILRETALTSDLGPFLTLDAYEMLED